MAELELPDTMARLPRAGALGLPVPFVASWSSERWHAIRHDPVVGRQALFTAGRAGRGRALFGVTNEPRQRLAVVRHVCGVCAAEIDGPGWLPAHDRIIEGHVAPGDLVDLAVPSTWPCHLAGARAAAGDDPLPVTHEPPCCLPCALWSATGCLAIRARTPALLRVDDYRLIVQLVDPSVAADTHDPRFDGDDDPLERGRLGRLARRRGGAVGYVKLAITASELLPLEAVEGATA